MAWVCLAVFPRHLNAYLSRCLFTKISEQFTCAFNENKIINRSKAATALNRINTIICALNKCFENRNLLSAGRRENTL